MKESLKRYTKIKRPWNPVDVYFGVGSSQTLGDVIQDMGHSYVFFVASNTLNNTTDIVKKLGQTLENYNIKTDLYTGVTPEPKIEVLDKTVDVIRKNNYDCVVGLGGGSVLDITKVAAIMANNVGKAESYLGGNKFTKDALDTILIPTTAGTGSEITNRAMVTTDEKAGFASDKIYPKVALVDPALTFTMSPKVTADTGFDALCHSMEGILSDEKFEGVEEVEKDGYAAIKLIKDNMLEAVGNGGDLEARNNMMYASLLSGFVLSRKAMVYGHSMAYPFAPRYNVPHGRSTAMVLPYIMNFYLSDGGSREKVSGMGVEMGINVIWGSENRKSVKAVKSIKKLIDKVYGGLEIPITLKELGVPKQDLTWMADLCIKRWPRPSSPINATEKDILSVYEKMWEGRL